MIIGIGIDLVSIERIGRIYNKFPSRFLNRIFTGREKEILMKRGSPLPAMAARFAAKEAVIKAIGCGIGPAAFKEVEVVTSTGRQPRIMLHGEALRLADEKCITEIKISMSHEPPLACAFATAVNSAARTAAD